MAHYVLPEKDHCDKQMNKYMGNIWYHALHTVYM